MNVAIIAGLGLMAYTLTVWAAIRAGRATRGASRSAWLVVEVVALLVALVLPVGGLIIITNAHTSPIFYVLTLFEIVLGFALAVLFIYGGYALRGSRRRFREDLAGSLWIARVGITRLGGGKPPPL